MALPSSGQIRLAQDVNTELGLTSTAQISLGGTNVRTLAGVASGQIRLGADLWGKSNTLPVGINTGGYSPTNSTRVATTVKFNFSTRAVTSGGSISLARAWPCGTSSTTFGLFAGGVIGTATQTNTIDKYTYASDTSVAVSAVLSQARVLAASTGEKTMGIFRGGVNGSTLRTTLSEKYTYSSDSIATTTPLVGQFTYSTAITDGIVGIWVGGITSSIDLDTTEKYTYTTATNSNAITLPAKRDTGAACGTKTYGYVMGGNGPTVTTEIASIIRYQYSNDVVTTIAATLSAAKGYNPGIGDTLIGVSMGGQGASITAVTDILTYSGETVAGGTSLPAARDYHGATGPRYSGLH